MTKIKPLPAKTVIKALEKIGFKQLRQKGSHLFMRHPDGRLGHEFAGKNRKIE
jgi:predicted RNA binding protein YcfA (HicA-like mRNA interferase family)